MLQFEVNKNFVRKRSHLADGPRSPTHHPPPHPPDDEGNISRGFYPPLSGITANTTDEVYMKTHSGIIRINI